MKWDKRARAQINIGGAGDNTIIGTPGATSIIEIDHINFVVTGTANTITIKDGINIIADYPLAQNSSFVFDNMNPNLNALGLTVDSSFTINLYNLNSSVKGFVLYRVTDQ